MAADKADYVNPPDREEMQVTDHAIDPSRIVVHDCDRLGDFYDAWCTCGAQLARYAPHYSKEGECGRNVGWPFEGCGDSVETALDRHIARLRGEAS